jgi:hypothetical protein
MKVIKKGRPQRGWAKQITCTGKGHGRGGCGAVLLIEESDLFYGERWIMGREHDDWVYFVCSECGVSSDVNGYPGDKTKLRKRHEIVGALGDKAEVRSLKPEPVTACCAYAAGAEGFHPCEKCRRE